MAALAANADLLIHECSFPEPFDVTNHSTPRKLGGVLRNMFVKRVVLTHLYPQAQGHEDEMAEQVIESMRSADDRGVGLDERDNLRSGFAVIFLRALI